MIKIIFSIIFCVCWGKGNDEEEKVKLEQTGNFDKKNRKNIEMGNWNFLPKIEILQYIKKLGENLNFSRKTENMKQATKQ